MTSFKLNGKRPVLKALLPIALMLTPVSLAQQFVQFGSPQEDQEDIQITAVSSMNFDNSLGRFEASGDTQTLSGELVIFADNVVADYSVDEGGGRTVEKFVATGNVFLVSDTIEAQSESMEADLVIEQFEFFGRDVQLSTGDARIFSDQFVSINQSSGELFVRSSPMNSFLLRENQTISADALNLNFDIADESGAGDLSDLESFEAVGNVRGDIGGALLSADALISDSEGIEIQLFGNVRISQDGTVLGGDCMTYNSDNGNTSLFQCPQAGTAGSRVFGQLQLTK